MINDLRGHVAGDAVIARTANSVRESIRQGDVCARLGGDEFLVFASDCDAVGAEKIARKILARLSKHEMPLARVNFSASIGIAVHKGPDALQKRRTQRADDGRHFGLVVDDKDAVRKALAKAGIQPLPGPFLDFLDP